MAANVLSVDEIIDRVLTRKDPYARQDNGVVSSQKEQLRNFQLQNQNQSLRSRLKILGQTLKRLSRRQAKEKGAHEQIQEIEQKLKKLLAKNSRLQESIYTRRMQNSKVCRSLASEQSMNRSKSRVCNCVRLQRQKTQRSPGVEKLQEMTDKDVQIQCDIPSTSRKREEKLQHIAALKKIVIEQRELLASYQESIAQKIPPKTEFTTAQKSMGRIQSFAGLKTKPSVGTIVKMRRP